MFEIDEKLNHANHFNLLCLGSILLESGCIKASENLVL